MVLEQVLRLLPSFGMREVDELGPGAVVRGRPYVDNVGRIRIGNRFHFSSSPAPSHLVTGARGSIEIGDDVTISHGAALSAQVGIRIGPGTRIGPYVVVMDSDYHVVGGGGAAEPAPITIGARVTLGSRVTILRGTVIGDGAEVGSGSVVSGVIEPGAVVAGVPARPVGSTALEGVDRTDLREIVRRIFGLATQPSLEDGPDTLAEWDSLGSLKLLLALEEAFDITLPEDRMRSVRSVGELARTIAELAH